VGAQPSSRSYLWVQDRGTSRKNVGALAFGALSAAQMDEVGAQMRLAV
jgi:hypothetical protein